MFARICNLAALSVLARQLHPEDFGTVAIVQVLLMWLTVSGDAGVSAFVITDAGRGRGNRLATAFSCQLGLLAAQLVLALAAGPLLLRFLHAQHAVPLLGVMLISIMMRGVAVVPDSLLRRRMQNRELATIDSSLDLLSAIVAVVLALLGAGIWSLVVPAVVASVLRTALVYRLAQWTPRIRFDRTEGSRVMRLSGHGLATTTLGFVLNDGDTMIIQRTLGAASLGFYNLGWTLANVSNRLISGVVTSLSLPALATLQSAPAQLGRAHLRFVRICAALAIPTSATLLVLAPDVVRVVYGARWQPSVILLQILLVFTAVRAFTSSTAGVFILGNRPDLGTKMNLGALAVYLPAIWLASSRGVLGVAIAVTVVRVVVAVVAFLISLRLLKVSFRAGGAAVLPSLAGAVVAALMTSGVAHLLPMAPGFWRLAVLAPVALLAQYAFCRLLAPQAAAELTEIAKRLILKVTRGRQVPPSVLNGSAQGMR